jgi:hypothetical protein
MLSLVIPLRCGPFGQHLTKVSDEVNTQSNVPHLLIVFGIRKDEQEASSYYFRLIGFLLSIPGMRQKSVQ